MASLFNQTNVNTKRYFFATQVDGEQQLTIDYPVVSGISTTMVGITGAGGNEVQINQMPCIIGTEFVSGDQALLAGGASTYFTASTLTTSATGLSMSTDRIPGTGIACIESYGTNGSIGGFEFLSRRTNAELFSTSMDYYLSSIGRPGATATLGATGTLAVANTIQLQQNVPLGTPGNYGSNVPVFPASKTNTEFGAGGPNNVVPITSALTNMFSVPLTGLNPNTQTLLNINFQNALSSTSNLVTYKVGFSTSTAYTNILQTTTVGGGSWTPGGIPSAATPITATNICAMLDSDGVNPDGTATLYINAQLANPSATADQIFIKKGLVTEPTRNAIVYRPV